MDEPRNNDKDIDKSENQDTEQTSSCGPLMFIGFVLALTVGKVMGKAAIDDPHFRFLLFASSGGLVVGILCGIIPLIYGYKKLLHKNRIAIIWGCFIVCSICGLVGGLILAVPACILSVVAMYCLNNKERVDVVFRSINKNFIALYLASLLIIFTYVPWSKLYRVSPAVYIPDGYRFVWSQTTYPSSIDFGRLGLEFICITILFGIVYLIKNYTGKPLEQMKKSSTEGNK